MVAFVGIRPRPSRTAPTGNKSWFGEMKADIDRLIDKMRKERRRALIVSPILIALFGTFAAWAGWLSLNYIDRLYTRVIPDDTGPEVLRAILLHDLYSILAPLLIVAVCLFSIISLTVMLVPKSERQLLLRIAEQTKSEENATDQAAARGPGTASAEPGQ